jgi:ferric-dicitrate binding protein FerR (iron transport regulator)
MKNLTEKYNLNKISDKVEKSVLESILSDINNQNEASEILKIHEASNHLKTWKSFNSSKAWAEISPQINNDHRIGWYKYAAVAVVLIFSIFAIKYFNEDNIKYRYADKSDHLVLTDGSDIILGKGAVLELTSDFISGNRIVKLDGSAYFNVARGTFPFTIKTEGKDITVLGTQFYIDKIGTGIKVDLIEGKVSINNNNGKTAVLQSGHSALIDDIKIDITSSKITEHKVYNDLKFDDVTVDVAIDSINSIYNKAVIVLNNDIKDLGTETIHTTIRNSSVKDFARFMEIVFDVNVINSKGQFIISSK